MGDPAQGGLFYPYVTLNWFEPGTSVDLTATDWPPPSHFDGRFAALGIFLLGPYGTCAQRLAALPLAAAPPTRIVPTYEARSPADASLWLYVHPRWGESRHRIRRGRRVRSIQR